MSAAGVPMELQCPGPFAASVLPDRVIYLHGFRSSPNSVKALKVKADFEANGVGGRLWVPSLPASPKAALSLVEAFVAARRAENPRVSLAFVGSSLGGYYATVLGQRHPSARVLLLNPAVKPYDDLRDQIGQQKVYFSDEEIQFVPAYLQELKDMEVGALTDRLRYCLVAASGDEVLDFGMMTDRYQGAHQMRLQGSDHALSEFDQVWPLARLFLGLK